MLRFFTHEPAEEVADETTPASWYDSLSAATGWLNPFNLTRTGASKTLFASLLFFKNMTTAVAASCFKIIKSDSSWNHMSMYKLDCHYTGQEDRLMNLVINNGSYNVRLIQCDEYDESLKHRFSVGALMGRGYFGNEYYNSPGKAACELDCSRDDVDDCAAFDPLRQMLEPEVKDGWGSDYDFGVTLTVAIPCGFAIIAMTCLGSFYMMNRIWESRWNAKRLRNNKYAGLTEALAENDVELLNNLKEMAIESQIVLPKELMFYILEQTKGYYDADYREKYFATAAHNPCPDDFVATPANGERAPIIRFCDSAAREKYREKAFARFWKKSKAEMREQVKLVEVIVDDPRLPLLEDIDTPRLGG